VIEWLTWVEVGVAVLAGIVALVLGLAGRRPDDISLGALVLVELGLLVQVVVACIGPAWSAPPSGNPVEFWIYLVTAALLPPLGILFWAFVDRSRWATVALGVVALAVAVMLWRMHEIWFVQGA
jgi:hypothetical protein